jgi:hypothetical protein
MVDFFTARDLRTDAKAVWDSLSKNGQLVITSKGKPKALMLDLSNADLEETLLYLHKVRAEREMEDRQLAAN